MFVITDFFQQPDTVAHCSKQQERHYASRKESQWRGRSSMLGRFHILLMLVLDNNDNNKNNNNNNDDNNNNNAGSAQERTAENGPWLDSR